MKKSTIGKIVAGVIAGIVVLLAAGVVVSVIWVRSFVPTGDFEGIWQGTITFDTPIGDEDGRYHFLDQQPMNFTLEIDEQSRTYGHIRIITGNELILNDEIFTSRFGKKRILPGDDEFQMEGTVAVEDDKMILECTFTYKGFYKNVELTGEIRATRISEEVDLFRDQYVPR
jgi:hypothetical protein